MPVRRDSNHRTDLMYDRLISRGSAARAPGFCVLRGGQNMLSFRHSPFLASNLLSSNRCLKWRRCGYSRRFPSYSQWSAKRKLSSALCNSETLLWKYLSAKSPSPLARRMIKNAIANLVRDCCGHGFKRCRSRQKFRIDR